MEDARCAAKPFGSMSTSIPPKLVPWATAAPPPLPLFACFSAFCVGSIPTVFCTAGAGRLWFGALVGHINIPYLPATGRLGVSMLGLRSGRSCFPCMHVYWGGFLLNFLVVCFVPFSMLMPIPFVVFMSWGTVATPRTRLRGAAVGLRIWYIRCPDGSHGSSAARFESTLVEISPPPELKS